MIVRKAVLTFVFLALACAALTIGPNTHAEVTRAAGPASLHQMNAIAAPLADRAAATGENHDERL